jgi:hypothetical protein
MLLDRIFQVPWLAKKFLLGGARRELKTPILYISFHLLHICNTYMHFSLRCPSRNIQEGREKFPVLKMELKLSSPRLVAEVVLILLIDSTY